MIRLIPGLLERVYPSSYFCLSMETPIDTYLRMTITMSLSSCAVNYGITVVTSEEFWDSYHRHVLLQTKVSVDHPGELAPYVQHYLRGPLLKATLNTGVLLQSTCHSGELSVLMNLRTHLTVNTFRIKTSIRTNYWPKPSATIFKKNSQFSKTMYWGKVEPRQLWTQFVPLVTPVIIKQ